VHEAERLFAEAAAFTGPQLTRQASDERLSTIKESHVQKNFRAALKRLAADASPRPRVSPTLSHRLMHEWPRLGLFDISLGWGDATVFGELSCGEEDLTLSARRVHRAHELVEQHRDDATWTHALPSRPAVSPSSAARRGGRPGRACPGARDAT
jgi:hypothetical protein